MDYPASVANVGLVNGKFANENTATGGVGSLIPAEWGNGVTDEIINVIKAAGLTPSESDLTQLLRAIRTVSASPVGTMRNGAMRVATPSQSATFTADEVVVETALGGQSYRLANFSQTINLATTGTGGMDTGSAPASGFVALYAIYSPTTKAQGILAVNATAAKAPEVYGGSNMPSGYTASALVSVYPTNSSGQLVAGQQYDRDIYGNYSLALNTSTSKTSYTALSVGTIVPLNAKRAMVSMSCSQGSSGSGVVLNLSGSADGIGGWGVQANSASSTSGSTSYGICPILTAQTLFYSMNNTNSGSYQIYINGYSF